MTGIQIDTDEVLNVGTQFNTKAGELDSLVQQARNLMNSLDAGWKGIRKSNTFEEWNRMQQNLNAAIETLQATSRILKQAATDFDTTDRA